MNAGLVKGWGIKDNNAVTAIRVLKTLDFLTNDGQPTQIYQAFMQKKTGPAVLGEQMRQHYAKLFESCHEPYNESDDELRGLFNIHAGGSEQTIRRQIQTFKALTEYATFDGLPSGDTGGQAVTANGSTLSHDNIHVSGAHQGPSIHIDLHIHLPENKGSREYQAIIEDIGRYIFGREGTGNE